MRLSLGLALAVAASVASSIVGCGSSGDDSSFGDPNATPPNSLDGQPGFVPGSSGGTSGSSGNAAQQDVDVASMRIDPADATLAVLGGQQATKPYKVFAKLKGSPTEIDITSRSVFYVPDNYLVGGFPTTAARSSRRACPRPRRILRSAAASSRCRRRHRTPTGRSPSKTSLTVKLSAILQSDRRSRRRCPRTRRRCSPERPSPVAVPALAYPNNNAMLPPNLRRLEVHWTPTGGTNLYQVSFISAVAEITYYSRCGGATTKPAEFKAGRAPSSSTRPATPTSPRAIAASAP